MISGGKFESDFNDSAYKVDMVLHIRSVGPADFGSYKCVAKNSLGETDGTIKLYSKFYHMQYACEIISIDHKTRTPFSNANYHQIMQSKFSVGQVCV